MCDDKGSHQSNDLFNGCPLKTESRHAVNLAVTGGPSDDSVGKITTQLSTEN